MLSTCLELLGAVLVVAGVYLLAGPGWALIAAGAFGFVVGVLIDFAERPKEA